HLVDNPEYVEHYAEQSEQGAFVVLDNSAYEFGTSVDVEQLYRWAQLIKADEIVIPDVLRDKDGTLALTKQAIDFFARRQDEINRVAISLMLVPQGQTIYEWGICLEQLVTYFRMKLPD